MFPGSETRSFVKFMPSIKELNLLLLLILKFLDLSKSEMSLYVLDSPLNSSITLMSSS